MDKQVLIQIIVESLQQELAKLHSIVAQARLDVIHGEMKQEGKYDTRSIEAGYLAGAHKRRLEELQAAVDSVRLMSVDRGVEKITVGSYVELRQGEELKRYFIVSIAAGFEVSVEGQKVFVISHNSPLARKLWGKQAGDGLELVNRGEIFDYEITKLL